MRQQQQQSEAKDNYMRTTLKRITVAAGSAAERCPVHIHYQDTATGRCVRCGAQGQGLAPVGVRVRYLWLGDAANNTRNQERGQA